MDVLNFFLPSHFIKHTAITQVCSSNARERQMSLFLLYCSTSYTLAPSSPLIHHHFLLLLAAVVLLCVAEWLTARNRDGLSQAFPEVSIGDLPAAPGAPSGRAEARAGGGADRVSASQASGHRRLEGQCLHEPRGVRTMLVLLQGEIGLRRVATQRGALLVVVATTPGPGLPLSTCLSGGPPPASGSLGCPCRHHRPRREGACETPEGSRRCGDGSELGSGTGGGD